MSHLPRAGRHQHDNLRKTVPDRLRIRRLTQISVIRLPLTLVLLLSPDILKLVVEIANFRGHVRDVAPVLLDVCL
jgi:hypothetical protein